MVHRKQIEPPNVVQTQPTVRVQDVTYTVQMQDRKPAGWYSTMHTQVAFTNLKSNNADKLKVNNNENNYYLPDHNQVNDKTVSAEITKQLQRDFKDVFSRIGCLHKMFLLQVKPDSNPYQAPLKCAAYALQKPFKQKLE